MSEPEFLPATPANIEPLRTADTTPMALISMAVAQGAPIDTIERLVALQEKMAASAAEQAWGAAMSRVQAAMGRISADATNPQTHSKYASYAAIDRELRPIYSREGFALSFGTEPLEESTLLIQCHVSHSAGHTRTFSAPMPTDGKGAKGNDVMTKTHATGSAMAYGMRYLLKMIFNVAVGEEDRDGNAFGVDESAFQAHMKAIREAKTIEELQKVWHVAMESARKDKQTQGAYINAKDERKGILRGAK